MFSCSPAPADSNVLAHRYWINETYEARHAESKEPESIDKEFLRLWFRERCDPYADKVTSHSCMIPSPCSTLFVHSSCRCSGWPGSTHRWWPGSTHGWRHTSHVYLLQSNPARACRQELPEAPAELVAQLSKRYIQLYEMITGEQFEPVHSAQDPQERMAAAIQAALQELQT